MYIGHLKNKCILKSELSQCLFLEFQFSFNIQKLNEKKEKRLQHKQYSAGLFFKKWEMPVLIMTAINVKGKILQITCIISKVLSRRPKELN